MAVSEEQTSKTCVLHEYSKSYEVQLPKGDEETVKPLERTRTYTQH